jgi:hypothetical protein
MHNADALRIGHEASATKASGKARNVRAMNRFVPCLAVADARRRGRFTPLSGRDARVVHCASCVVHYGHQ